MVKLRQGTSNESNIIIDERICTYNSQDKLLNDNIVFISLFFFCAQSLKNLHNL